MTYHQQKQRIQICISLDDLAFIEHFADKTGAKNASGAIHELIYDYKVMQNAIEQLKQKYVIAQQKETYEQVRNEQIQKPNEKPGLTANKDPYKDPKWSFLGKPEDPNLKSKIKNKKREYSESEKEEAVKRLKK